MADLLFESSGASLRKMILREQGFSHASMMVLHTWNQKLQPHWHVHALVPGGGPSLITIPFNEGYLHVGESLRRPLT